MDDGCCAVCAEAVGWVAYGPCGHRDVCSTCIARLRFVCNDRRCCICQSHSEAVFVTKALGSFTRIINDFSILPADGKDGKVGSYWFHEGIQAYFDDFDEYKIIKAMCRLSCSSCDKSEAERRRTSNRKGKFRNVEQLRDHLSRQHELFFCSLCLEHKKVFICEQKLYSQVQLRRHIRYGDSEVDGDESERCGFLGHPICEYCQTPFYGDNELYFHMSTEHYTCHICQRQHPTKYAYYKDYNDLENHFRQAHFLCEDDSCLEKKFIVFATEADMKRHNALEHGGHMSRSKRNTALQLPTCFRYREEEPHRVRGHLSGRGVSDLQLSLTTPARAERADSNLLHDASSILRVVPAHSGTNETGSTSDPVPSSGQVRVTSLDFRSVVLSGSAFPPLPTTSKRRRRKSKKNSEGKSTRTVVGPHSTLGSSAVNGSSVASPASNHTPSSSSSSSSSNLVDLVSADASACGEPALKGDANKSLAEAIHAALEFDKDKFDIFKIISKEYRESVIDAGDYLAHVHQFGLAHLILDLARLYPDLQKQKELLEVHQTTLGDVKENGKRSSSKGSKKGKEKCEDNIVSHLKGLKLDIKEETSSSTKGKSSTPVVEKTKMPSTEPRNEDVDCSNGSGSNNSTGTKKKVKKKSKFLRTHVGESSASGVQDLEFCDLGSEPMVTGPGPNQDSILTAVRGVWRNGGGRRLVALTQASSSAR